MCREYCEKKYKETENKTQEYHYYKEHIYNFINCIKSDCMGNDRAGCDCMKCNWTKNHMNKKLILLNDLSKNAKNPVLMTKKYSLIYSLKSSKITIF